MTVDEYKAALEKCDWFYEYSDDNRWYERGRDAMKALREAQRRLDPQGILWNSFAPRDYQIASK